MGFEDMDFFFFFGRGLKGLGFYVNMSDVEIFYEGIVL